MRKPRRGKRRCSQGGPSDGVGAPRIRLGTVGCACVAGHDCMLCHAARSSTKCLRFQCPGGTKVPSGILYTRYPGTRNVVKNEKWIIKIILGPALCGHATHTPYVRKNVMAPLITCALLSSHLFPPPAAPQYGKTWRAAALRRYWSPFSLLCDTAYTAHAFFLPARKETQNGKKYRGRTRCGRGAKNERPRRHRTRESCCLFYFIALTSARWTKAPHCCCHCRFFSRPSF